jgi:hypothetical protein
MRKHYEVKYIVYVENEDEALEAVKLSFKSDWSLIRPEIRELTEEEKINLSTQS